jgi:glycosyltransferase involved in cell wall biosynthesis
MNDLAIVIPAYKSKYCKQTLDSIAKQTCKNFTLYIGDDASGTDIAKTVKQYINKINIKYHYFEKNLGSTDLVAQWERCIDLINNEKWIWLFSDDDIMSENCVEEFYKQVAIQYFDIYHFNTKTIGNESHVIRTNKNFPKIITAYDFCKSIMGDKLKCYVVEYIFSRERFFEKGRFQNFDLAWWSDVATWIKISNEKGIYTLDNACVYWRASGLNITTDFSKDIVIRKVNADIQFLKWVNKFLTDKKLYNYCFLFRFYFSYSNVINLAKKHDKFIDFCKTSIKGRLFIRLLKLIFPNIVMLKRIRLKLKLKQ